MRVNYLAIAIVFFCADLNVHLVKLRFCAVWQMSKSRYKIRTKYYLFVLCRSLSPSAQNKNEHNCTNWIENIHFFSIISYLYLGLLKII